MREHLASTELRTTLRNALAGVDGWFNDGEAWVMHEAARRACMGAAAPTIVEIGSYKGKSTIALALGVQAAGGGGRVFAVDPHEMDPGQYEAFLQNIESAGVRDLIEPIRTMSHDARPRFPDGSVDLLFVDGSHEYDDVVQDVRDWQPALAPGAVAAFNDPFWRQVSRALTDTLAQRGSPFRHPRAIDSTLFFDYSPGAPWTPRDSIALRRVRFYLRLGRRWREFHWRFVTKPKVPLWAKKLQLRIAMMTFAVVLPKAKPKGA